MSDISDLCKPHTLPMSDINDLCKPHTLPMSDISDLCKWQITLLFALSLFGQLFYFGCKYALYGTCMYKWIRNKMCTKKSNLFSMKKR